MSDFEWFRSSFCASGACVEVAVSEFGDVLVSDSKLGDASPFRGFSSGCWSRVLEDIRDGCLPDGVTLPTYGTVAWGVLEFTNDEWDAFVAGVKAGEFDYDKLSSGDEAGSGFRGVARSGQAATGAGAIAVPPVPVAANPTIDEALPIEPVPGEHYWVSSRLTSCRWCGIVRRYDRANGPCKGRVHVELRQAAAGESQASEPARPVPVAAQPEISNELVELVAEAEYEYDYEADPIPEGLVIPWSEAISLVRNSYVRRARAGLEVALPLLRKQLLRDPAHQCTYAAVYSDAQKALDELLGPDEEDGCDGGLVADIWHLARRCEHFEQATTPEPAWGSGPLVKHVTETPAEPQMPYLTGQPVSFVDDGDGQATRS